MFFESAQKVINLFSVSTLEWAISVGNFVGNFREDFFSGKKMGGQFC